MFKKALATVAAAATLSSPAYAAELETDIDVTLPSIIVLSCYDSVDVNVTAAGLLTAMGTTVDATTADGGTIDGGAAGSITATGAAGELTADATALTVGTADTDVKLNMTNICAFRAIGAANGVTVSVATTTNTTLDGPSGTSIVVSDPKTRENGGGAFSGTSYDVAAADLGFGSVKGVDVQVELDLSGANVAGDYSSSTDGTFKVTVVGKP